MANQKRDAAAIGREALDVVALMYHHCIGEKTRDFIRQMDEEVPNWRRQVSTLRDSKESTALKVALVWDRAIKLLVKAGRLEE